MDAAGLNSSHFHYLCSAVAYTFMAVISAIKICAVHLAYKLSHSNDLRIYGIGYEHQASIFYFFMLGWCNE